MEAGRGHDCNHSVVNGVHASNSESESNSLLEHCAHTLLLRISVNVNETYTEPPGRAFHRTMLCIPALSPTIYYYLPLLYLLRYSF